MANLNRVFLIGNLTRDPEIRYTPNGTAVTSFGMAINRTYTTQSGEKKEETCFVRVVVFGKQAESCSQYLSKGRQVFVEGRLQYRAWEVEGQKRSTLDIVASRVQFLGRVRPEELETGIAPEEPEIKEETASEETPEEIEEPREAEDKSDEQVPF